jgi:regulator of protease activity HflC (stomatin/prohibitin superfamily)
MRELVWRLAGLASLGWLCSCATVVVSPGHRAVLMAPDGAMRVLDEGVASVPPLSHVDDFDLRQQDQGATITAITADGVPVIVGDPSFSYALVAEELVAADRQIGPDHWRSIVEPIVHSTVTSVLASYRWDQLDTASIREAQTRIAALASARLRPYHIVLAAVDLKGIRAKLPGRAHAVLETAVWEQRSAEAKTRVELARQNAVALREKATGMASLNESVAPTLSPIVLQEKANKAWAALITSPTAAVHVVNDHSPLLEVTP